jgi:hypothetical protein
MLMINNHFTLFQLPGNLPKTKKNVLPISVATRNFLFIYLCQSFCDANNFSIPDLNTIRMKVAIRLLRTDNSSKQMHKQSIIIISFGIYD